MQKTQRRPVAPQACTIFACEELVNTAGPELAERQEMVRCLGKPLPAAAAALLGLVAKAARLHRSIRAHLVRQLLAQKGLLVEGKLMPCLRIPAIKRLADENFQAVFQQAEEAAGCGRQ